jgi:uncharacterized membrane protein YbhN (UPF0104 family)
MGERLRNALPAAVGLALFVVALEVLRTELGTISWRALSANVTALPRARLALAAALTAVNYAILTGYDFLALAYVKRKLPLLVLGGFSLWTLRLPDVVGGLAPAAISTIGAGLMLAGTAYVVAAAMRLRPIRVKRLVVSLPSQVLPFGSWCCRSLIGS